MKPSAGYESFEKLVLARPIMSVIENQLKKSIKAATLELCCGDECLRDRLLRAIGLLDSFLGQREEDLAASMYTRAQDISDEMKSAGAQDLDLPGLQRLAERILHLYADCHSAPQQSKSEAD